MPEVLECFVRNPLETFEETERFVEDIREYVFRKSRDLEKNLENSNIRDGDLRLDNLTVFAASGTENQALDMICRVLVLHYSGDIPDVQGGLIKLTEKYFGEDIQLDDGFQNKKVKKINRVYEFLEKNSEKIDESLRSQSSASYHGYYTDTFGDENGIVLKRLPANYSPNSDNRVLSQAFEIFSYEKEGLFNDTLMHELNHCFLDQETSDYRHFSTSEPGEAFNEIFAYFTSYLVSRESYRNQESDLYRRPDIIVWGVNVLIQKNKELQSLGKKKTGIDFGRELMKRLSEVEDGSPFWYFVDFCLLTEDEKRLKRFNEVTDNLEDEIRSFQEFLDSLEPGDFKGDASTRKTKNTRTGYLQDSIKSPIRVYREDTREKVVIEIAEKARLGKVDPEEFDLKEINRFVTGELSSRIEKLEKAEEKIGEDLEWVEQPEPEKAFREVISEMKNSQKLLRETVEKGKLKT